MKYHIDRAVEINPEDSIAWNLLGMWHFEVNIYSKQEKSGLDEPGAYRPENALYN